jgi:hypothetical protein
MTTAEIEATASPVREVTLEEGRGALALGVDTIAR